MLHAAGAITTSLKMVSNLSKTVDRELAERQLAKAQAAQAESATTGQAGDAGDAVPMKTESTA